jgi:hypothetical protein
MRVRFALLVLTATSVLALPQIAQATKHAMKSDPGLLAALRSDARLNGCRCILAAVWLNESYPRVVVDTTGWKRLGHKERALFGARALRVAEATFLTEFGVPDQYEQIFIVDQSGRPLASYPV